MKTWVARMKEPEFLIPKWKWNSLSHVWLFMIPRNSPGQNTRVGSLSLLQGIFPTQGSNPGLLHCWWILNQLSYQGSPWCPWTLQSHASFIQTFREINYWFFRIFCYMQLNLTSNTEFFTITMVSLCHYVTMGHLFFTITGFLFIQCAWSYMKESPSENVTKFCKKS